MRRIIWLKFYFLFLITPLVVPISTASAQSVQRVDATTIGNIALVSETGQSIRLSDYRGKAVFLNFWGSWCTPCLQEMTSIRNLQAQLGDRRGDIVFAFVSAKTQEFEKDSAWLKQHGIAGTSYRWAAGSPALYVPTTFILDPTGAVAEFRNTSVDWEIHSDLIRNLLPRASRQAKS